MSAVCWDRLDGFVAPGLVAHRTRLPDLTVATDDVATTRWQRCTFCQGVLTAFAFRVWQDGRHVVGVVLCPQCQRLGEDLVTEAVDLMLRARYDPQRFAPTTNGGPRGPDDASRTPTAEFGDPV